MLRTLFFLIALAWQWVELPEYGQAFCFRSISINSLFLVYDNSFDEMISTQTLKKQLANFHMTLDLFGCMFHFFQLSQVSITVDCEQPNSAENSWVLSERSDANAVCRASLLTSKTCPSHGCSLELSHHLHSIFGNTFPLSFHLKSIHLQIRILNNWPQLLKMSCLQ